MESIRRSFFVAQLDCAEQLWGSKMVPFSLLVMMSKGLQLVGFSLRNYEQMRNCCVEQLRIKFWWRTRYSDGVSNAVKFYFHPCPGKWSKLTNAFTEGKHRCLHEDGFMLRGYVWFWESNCAIWFCTSKKWRQCLGVCCFWCWCGRNSFFRDSRKSIGLGDFNTSRVNYMPFLP